MNHDEPQRRSLVWRKARRSIADGECVEVAPADGCVNVRDSKNPEGPVLRYPFVEWDDFLAGAKKDDFDLGSLYTKIRAILGSE